MPLYDYHCPRCGMFSAMGAMETHDAPMLCPVCGASSSRVTVAAPAVHNRRAGPALTPTGRLSPTYSRGGHGPACPCCVPRVRTAEK